MGLGVSAGGDKGGRERDVERADVKEGEQLETKSFTSPQRDEISQDICN